jgi:hypothetical protein
MSLSANTTYRFYVEKLGAVQAYQFVGDKGESFYDPTDGQIRISDGVTPGGQNLVTTMIAFATAMGI